MSTNYIDQITDTAGTTHDISEGDSTRIFRATCSTAAGTTAKVATLQTSSRNFSLATGVRVAVTFTYGNSATTPTLNVNSTGAKTIAIATSTTAKTTGNGTTYNTWGPYETVLFTYDGTYWVNGGSSRAIYNAYNNIGEDTDTWRPIKIDDTQILAGTTDTNALNLKAGTGISLSNSSGTVTFNHSNSVTAKSTQAVYPITFDAQGHITGSGTAVTIPSAYTLPVATYNTLGGVKPWKSYTASSTGPTAATASTAVSVNAITNTASRYYAVEMDKDGRMFVNVPWTNVNSNYITSDSDEKLKIETISNNTNYSLLLMKSSGSIPRTDTGKIKAYEFSVITDGSSYSRLNIGGDNFRGQIGLGYKNDSVTYYTYLNSTHTSASRTISFPDKSGTVALTSDITGKNYTATSPIDITGDVISHETSGVTAGTYDGGFDGKSYYCIPSFTVDSKGHITSASETATTISIFSLSSPNVPGLVYSTAAFKWPFFNSNMYSAYDTSITPPATSVTITVTPPSMYYTTVMDVIAIDDTTKERVLVDWSFTPFNANSSNSITVTVSIAKSYANTIRISVMCKQYMSM